MVAYFMFLQIGWGSVESLFVLLLLISFQTVIAQLAVTYRTKLNRLHDEKIKVITDMIQGIMIIKVNKNL